MGNMRTTTILQNAKGESQSRVVFNGMITDVFVKFSAYSKFHCRPHPNNRSFVICKKGKPLPAILTQDVPVTLLKKQQK